MTDKDGFYGVYFKNETSEFDEEEVRNAFSKYGRIVFVKHHLQRVYVNFKLKSAAENCLLDAPNSKYGEVRRGKFGTDETQNSAREMNNLNSNRTDSYTLSKKTDIIERKQRSSCTSHVPEYDDMLARNIEANSLDNDTPNHGGNSSKSKNEMVNGKKKNYQKISISPRKIKKHQMNSDSEAEVQHHAFNKTSMLCETKPYSSNRPPPLLSADVGPPPLLSLEDGTLSYDGPPPLVSVFEASHSAPRRSFREPRRQSSLCTPPQLMQNDFNPEVNCQNSPHHPFSVDSGPPPLISALEVSHRSTVKSTNRFKIKQALLPTPHPSMRIEFDPEFNCSQSSSQDSGSPHGAPDIPPPLVSAISRSKQDDSWSPKNSSYQSAYEDYVQKYGNYVLIANVPHDITTDEVEKVLYPYIPTCVSDPEVTNIRLKLLFCLVTFNTLGEATKAAQLFDGIELRGQCLSMIRLDELITFNRTPF